MIFDTSFRVPWTLLGSLGFMGLMALFQWWLFRGCKRYTRGELSRAFPEVARLVLINRIVSIIAPLSAGGLLLFGLYGMLPKNTALLYLALCVSLVPITELRLHFGLGVYIGTTFNGTYYVRESLSTNKRLALVVKQIALFAGVYFVAKYALIAISIS